MSNMNLFAVPNAILLIALATSIDAQGLFSNIFKKNGPLPTPEEGCGISKVATTKIVGGKEAKPGAYPWLTLLGARIPNGQGDPFEIYGCGGTLITSRHVLTAAHCLNPKLNFVRLGAHDYSLKKDENRQDINVIKSVAHPKYNGTQKGYDIAILTLEKDADFNDRVRPVCLPLSKDLKGKSFTGTNPFAVGWGRTSEKGSWANVLMEVQLPVLSNEKCRDLYGKEYLEYRKNEFGNIVLCAGNLAGGQDVCNGDSGGPLLLPILEKGQFITYQIGIISYGIGCAEPNLPGIYTRVSEFIDWIKDEVNQK